MKKKDQKEELNNSEPQEFSTEGTILVELAGTEEPTVFITENPNFFWETASYDEMMNFIENGDDFKDDGLECQFYKYGEDQLVKKHTIARIKKNKKLSSGAIKRIILFSSRFFTKQLDCHDYFDNADFCEKFVKICVEKKYLKDSTNPVIARFFAIANERYVKQLLNQYLKLGINIPLKAQSRLALRVRLDFVRPYIASYLAKGLNLKHGFEIALLSPTSPARRLAFLEALVQSGKTLSKNEQNILVLLGKDEEAQSLMLQNLANGGLISASKPVINWMLSQNFTFVIESIAQNHQNGYKGKTFEKIHFLVATNNDYGKDFHKDKRRKYIKELLGK